MMPLLSGHSLQKHIDQQPDGSSRRIPVREVVLIGLQLASGLDEAHRHGLVHRDLKPGNVFVTQREVELSHFTAREVKILDFGLVRTSRAQRPLVEGTPDNDDDFRVSGLRHPRTPALDCFRLQRSVFRRVMRPGALVVFLFACGCRGPSLSEGTVDLSFSPAVLDFAEVAIGSEVSMTFELRNGGGAAAQIALSAQPPFSLAGPPSSIGGRSSSQVTVTFRPTAVGVAVGAVRQPAPLVDLVLRGNGLAACQTAQPCASPVFDLATRRCSEAAKPDGTPCSAPCLTGSGQCRDGYCSGVLTSCIDSNPCTIDACATDGTCVHPPLECPAAACQASFCDPVTGCGSEAVEDGLPCGEATCEAARICLGGQCQLRTRPNAAADCRYTRLEAGPDQTCAVTVGGDLRCWGDNQADQQGRGYPSSVAPPGFAQGLGSVRSVAAPRYSSIWVARSADVAQTNGPRVVSMGVTALAAGSRHVCGLDLGQVRCADVVSADGGPIVTVAAEVVGLSMSSDELCTVGADGGVRCGSITSLASVWVPGAARAVSSAGIGTGCALINDSAFCWGAVVAGGARVVWDAGVTAVTTSRYRASSTIREVACAATATGISCLPSALFTFPESGVTVRPVSQLTVGTRHGCALLDDGRTACWGSNEAGQLGNRSAQPLGPQQLPLRAAWLGQFDDQVLHSGASGAVEGQFMQGQRLDDAGALWLRPVIDRVPGTPGGYERGCPCALDGGPVCDGLGPLPLADTTACGLLVQDLCLASRGGTVTCYRPGDAGAEPFGAWDAGGPVVRLVNDSNGTGLCAVGSDGAVHCPGFSADHIVAESLTGVKDLCFAKPGVGGGCARLDTGQLRCWGSWVGSPTPIVPQGSWPIVRQLSCGAHHFCALSGTNIVRCFGNNQVGQLGRDGPASTQAVTVSMPEPVRSIASGSWHTCALLLSGKVVCWGSNSICQLGQPVLLQSAKPVIVVQ